MQTTPGNSQISIYRNIFDTTSQYTTTIDNALERIKTGIKSRNQISILRNESDENRISKLKEQLPSITFSGVFSERVDDKLVKHSGFICLDFDDVDVVECKKDFSLWEHTYAAFISPTGTGVKVLVRIANGKKHREHFAALKKRFKNTDEKCSNPSRVCYESYDPEIFINPNSKVFTEAITVEVLSDLKVTGDIFEIYQKLIKWTENCQKKDLSFHKGNRNQFAYVLSGAMCRYGIDDETATNLIVKDYSATDFTEKEISKSVKSAYKKNKNSFGTAEFSNESFRTKETKYEVNPDVILEGFKPDDVIYGEDVFDKAIEIYEKGYFVADTTHIPEIDKYFKWKRGDLTLFSGIGNYGKTSFLSQLLLIRSYFNGNKWAVFSPEHTPVEQFYFDLTETILGQPCDGGYQNKPSRKKFDMAYEFVANHFFYIYPESISPSPDYIKTKFLELILKEKVDGCIIDPFNQLHNDYGINGGRSDKYLETFLSDCSRFAKINSVYFAIVAHPTKMKKETDGNYPCPDVFDIADGAMWNNKCDNIVMYHRPYGQTDPNNDTSEFHSKKIRFQKILNVEKGMTNFKMTKIRRRFYFNGKNPLDGNRFESPPIPEQNELPLSPIKPHHKLNTREEDDNNSYMNDGECPF